MNSWITMNSLICRARSIVLSGLTLSAGLGVAAESPTYPAQIHKFGDWTVTIQPGFSVPPRVKELPPAATTPPIANQSGETAHPLPVRFLPAIYQAPGLFSSAAEIQPVSAQSPETTTTAPDAPNNEPAKVESTESPSPPMPIPPAPMESLPTAPVVESGVTISPDYSLPRPSNVPFPVPQGAAPMEAYDPLTLAKLYAQVYETIPFSRTEYRQNPGYRNQATLEILMRQLRPMSVQNTNISNLGDGGFGGFGGYAPSLYFYPFQRFQRNRLYIRW